MKKSKIKCFIEEHAPDAHISCNHNNKEIGYANVYFYTKSKSYPTIGIIVPAKTAVYGPTEVREAYRNKGYGTKMLKLEEQKSLERGMKRMQVPSVDNPHFFIKHGFYYTGRQRIFEKDLMRKTLTSSQKKKTDEYISIYKNIKER